MNKKMSKRQKDIKSKLMAAICMLLVSSIMMVSTTYAWFTLSTAPEVTGITTAVGANGNLEMALQPYNGDSDSIKSGTADSMEVQDVTLANVTWGNLVDLSATAGEGASEHNVYGLDKITLYPAALNFTQGTEATESTAGTPSVIGAQPLSTPVYGADGRVADLVEKTLTGVYQDDKFVESISVEGTTIEQAKGVRAVGISSGMSDRELAYRGATASASSADVTAKNKAATALRNHGNILADVAITHALGEDEEGGAAKAVYTKEQVAAMREVLTALVGDNSNPGAFTYIGNALLQYVYADTLALASDDNYDSLKTAFSTLTLDNVDEAPDFATSYTKMAAFFTTLTASKNAASTALSKLPGADEAGPFVWSDISDALGGLVNTSNLLINGKTVSEVTSNPGTIVSSVMKNGLKLTMTTGAGVFADIADFCGDYSASIIIDKLSYNGTDVEDVEATMETDTTVTPVYLEQAQDKVADFSGAGASTTKSITEYYGYIIDLAFRTNAAGSNLMLQQTGIDRIYNEQNNASTNPATQCGGAYMQFTTKSTTFTETAMENLMGAIRIVFFDTDSMNIVGYARLDAANMDPDTSAGIKMPIMMTDDEGNAITGDKPNKIMALEQNQVHELSVLVYLDGNDVENEDVAYDVAQSMEGTMNLQFSSDAILKPMEYKDLKEGTSSIEPTDPEIPEDTAAVDVTSITEGYAVTDGKGAYTESLKTVAVKITETTGNTEVTTGTVTINGVTASYSTELGVWTAELSEAPDELAITVA